MEGSKLMHWAIDCDDVMLNFFPNVLDCFEREFDIRPEYDGQPWGDLAKQFTRHPALIEAGYKDWWGWLRERDWLWGIAPAVPGSIGGVKTLRAKGHYTEMVTSKPEWAEPQVWRWLGKWRPPFEQVTISKPGVSKVSVTKADILIDDKPENVQEFAAAGRLGILFDLSGQHKGTEQDRIYVAHNWADVLAIEEGLSA